MARRMGLALVLLAALTRAATAGVFADIPMCGWFYSAVEKLASLGAVEGYADGKYRGPQPLSRDEFAEAMLQFRPAATRAMEAACLPSPTSVQRLAERQQTQRLQILALRLQHEEDLTGLSNRLGAVDTKLTDGAKRLNARLDGLAAADLAPLNARLDALDRKLDAGAARTTTAAGAANDLAGRHTTDMATLTAGLDRLAGTATALQPRTKAPEDDVAALYSLFGEQGASAKTVAGDVARGKAAVAQLEDATR